jgi:hypothetical protein
LQSQDRKNKWQLTVEEQTVALTKYPRTYHLPFSPGLQNDDRVIETLGGLIGQEVIVTEKMYGETFWSVLQAYDWYDAGLVPTIIKGPNVYTAGYDKLYTCPDHVDSSQTSPGVCKKCKVELREDGTFKFPLWVDQATGEITRNFLVEDFK